MITRRRFIQTIGLTTGAWGLTHTGILKLTDIRDVFDALHREESAHARLFPSAIRPLTTAETVTLWELFSFIGREWKLMKPEELSDRRAAFGRFLKAKTEEEPSYAVEYENAVALLDPSSSRYAGLLLGQGPLPSPLKTPMDHFRQFVVKEFADLHLITGGFKRFGYKNYPGYMGGPLNTHPFR